MKSAHGAVTDPQRYFNCLQLDKYLFLYKICIYIAKYLI